MSTYDDAKAALKLLHLNEIRRLVAELEAEYGLSLAHRDGPDEVVFRGPTAYGCAPPPEVNCLRGPGEELPPTDDRNHVVNLTSNGPNRIHVIKALREHLAIGLVEAKEFTDRVPCEVGEFRDMDIHTALLLAESLRKVGATVEVFRRVPKVREPEDFRDYVVELVNHGANKIQVIKTLRDHLGWGLLDAKRATESAPCSLWAYSHKDQSDADKLASALREAGATVVVDRN
jgi:large subunit ribosomal protein L7/L12